MPNDIYSRAFTLIEFESHANPCKWEELHGGSFHALASFLSCGRPFDPIQPSGINQIVTAENLCREWLDKIWPCISGWFLPLSDSKGTHTNQLAVGPLLSLGYIPLFEKSRTRTAHSVTLIELILSRELADRFQIRNRHRTDDDKAS